jgi:hypothetical protein
MSLNDVLLGRESGEQKPEEPYRTAAPMPPAKQPCAQCGTPSLLEQTPIGPRCATCALNYYRSVRNLAAANAPSVTNSGSDFVVRVVLRIAIAVIFGIIYAAMRMH